MKVSCVKSHHEWRRCAESRPLTGSIRYHSRLKMIAGHQLGSVDLPGFIKSGEYKDVLKLRGSDHGSTLGSTVNLIPSRVRNVIRALSVICCSST
jgi:hypothetical protein